MFSTPMVFIHLYAYVSVYIHMHVPYSHIYTVCTSLHTILLHSVATFCTCNYRGELLSHDKDIYIKWVVAKTLYLMEKVGTFGGSTLTLYHHVPAIYGFYRAYDGIFRELSQGYPHFSFDCNSGE